MNRKRTVFLLGAGAALDWHNAPTTTSLTNFLKCAGPKNSKGEYITKYIFDYFKDKYTEELNFEGLIDIVEQCLQFWSTKDSSCTIANSLIRPDDEFWKNTIDYKYFNPERDFGGDRQQTEESKFFAKLLIDILYAIADKISDYSFYTYNKNKIIDKEENTEITRLITEYIRILAKDNVLRVYSLNYDRVMQAVFQEAGVKVFQGFIPDDIVPKEGNQPQYPDTKRILTSFDEHCIYHLHGSIYWEPDNINPNGLEGYSFRNAYFLPILSNTGYQHFNAEKNKPLFLSNIITGYSKVQRTNLSPFKQMASAFDIDCHTADEIIIVGYSFGDDHINDAVRQGKKANPSVKITVITPAKDGKDKRDWQRKVMFEILSHIERITNFVFEDHINSAHSGQYKTAICFQTWRQYIETYLQNRQSHP